MLEIIPKETQLKLLPYPIMTQYYSKWADIILSCIRSPPDLLPIDKLLKQTFIGLLVAQIFQHFFEGANAKGARSTALHSLQWGLGMLLTGIPVAVWANSPTWVLIALVSFLAILFITYLGAYLYLLVKDRDALRSERYSLSKMAIERGMIGDSFTGLIEEENINKKLIKSENINDEEDKK